MINEIQVEAIFKDGKSIVITAVDDNGRTLQSNHIGDPDIKQKWLDDPNFEKAVASDGQIMDKNGFWWPSATAYNSR